jgi:BON domain
MSDQSLKQAVMDEFQWEPSVDAAHIGVTANNGVVTLTGDVGSYAQKSAAERAAGRVVGVKAVAEELEVRYPFASDGFFLCRRGGRAWRRALDAQPTDRAVRALGSPGTSK